MSLSTSNFKGVTGWRAAIVCVSLWFLIPAGFFATDSIIRFLFVDDASIFLGDLKVPPKDNDIYVLGNSMFRSGLDIERVRDALAGEQFSFEYNEGYYSNLWYSIIKNGLIPSGIEPKLLIWGFRPTYAMKPGFRKKTSPLLDKFLAEEDLLIGSEYAVLSGDSLIHRSDESVPAIEGKISDLFSNIATNFSVLYSRRDEFRGIVLREAARIGTQIARLFAKSTADEINEKVVRREDFKVADLILNKLSRGKYEMTEERVVDDGKGFTGHKIRSFQNSFVPKTSMLLKKQSIPQLVVIFPSANRGKIRGIADRFTREALEFFDSNGIRYINLYDHPAFNSPEVYADGDHLNSLGRKIMSDILIAELTKD